jgi:HK97 family phage prohead protease
MDNGRASARLKPLAALNGHGVFVGYASLFGRRDTAGDIVMKGAFAESIRTRGVPGIRMLFQHDAAEPVGTWIDIVEDERGLAVRGRLNPQVQRGRELIALLHGRALDGLSIGFRAVEARRDRMSGARRLHRVDLWEISLVTFPMLAGARVAQIRADALFTKRPTIIPEGVS